MKPQGIYTHYLQEVKDLHERLDLSIHMMSDLIVEESGNDKESIKHAEFIKEFIKDCPLESKLKIVKHLDC